LKELKEIITAQFVRSEVVFLEVPSLRKLSVNMFLYLFCTSRGGPGVGEIPDKEKRAK
jgi:hypothetical protein